MSNMQGSNNLRLWPEWTGEWFAPNLPPAIPHGDMPGDKVQISQEHIEKSGVIFPCLMPLLLQVAAKNPYERAIVAVYGGSGVGKSEIASLLSYYLRELGIGSYTLSGDNYPHRIPQYNDAERLRMFRAHGVRGLVTSGSYNPQIAETLRALQDNEQDSDPALTAQHEWLAEYQSAGRQGLKAYLGTPTEQNFEELGEVVKCFKNGADEIWLKRMGRGVSDLWYEKASFKSIQILVVEWTHGNSDFYFGVDIPILLNSTPQETQAHRKVRARDGKTDSAFTTMVLELEQQLLQTQSHKAKLIISKDGQMLSHTDYLKTMLES